MKEHSYQAKHGYRAILEQNAIERIAFLNLDCSYQRIDDDEHGRPMVHVFSACDIGPKLKVNPLVWAWDEMEKDELEQWL